MTTITTNSKIESLIESARKHGDSASINALYELYEEKFKSAAMYHFKRIPFDFDVARLPNSRYKQDLIISAAYDAFVKTYKTYDGSRGASFVTLLNRNIEWLFKDLQKENAKESKHWKNSTDAIYSKRKQDYTDDLENVSCSSRDAYDTCDTDMVNEVLNSMPENSAARKNAEALYRIFSEEGADKQCSAADRLGISRQAINKSFKSYREHGPKAIRDRVLEALREKASQRVVGTKTTNCNVFKDGSK